LLGAALRCALMPDFVYLASQSPRRRQLLEQLGVRHELLLPDADEDAEALEATHVNEAPLAYVKRVTALKLDAAIARLKHRGLPPAPVLCSDTTVAQGRTIFGKPADARDAARMLSTLSRGTHRVLTAVAVQHVRRRFEAVSVSRVSFDALTASQIRAYVATGEPMGKAGAYAIQGRFAMHISRINGSYSGIMGLPLQETAHLLRAAGFKI
jgi:septum formation protein